ncbi:hypothetical protein MXM52_13155 [Klebsiella quasipneumoniae]|nr:hypothetical protein [Klebsiella quasipneumoniae]MEB5816731.1 hypothetical protein [Klebsiella quasipneumoniae]
MDKKRTVTPTDMSCQANMLGYVFGRLIGGMSFVEIVRVIEVDNPPYMVDCEGLVLSTNANGDSLNDGGKRFSIPYLRLQSGTDGVIMPPKVGDMGLVVVCDQDITGVKDNKGSSVPHSDRIHNSADGVYLTSIACLSGLPTQYVEFHEDGIDIKSPGTVDINGMKILSDGRLQLVDGSIVDGHRHGGVISGGDSTAPLSP